MPDWFRRFRHVHQWGPTMTIEKELGLGHLLVSVRCWTCGDKIEWEAKDD